MNTAVRTDEHDAVLAWPVLQACAAQMQFYRFCEFLELSLPTSPPLGSTDSPRDDAVRFRARAGLGFPGRDIDTIDMHGDDAPPSVHTTFLGLYGVDARMPSYFVEEIARNKEGAEPLAAFLDLFHHRIVTQFFRIWRKYYYPAGFREDGSDATSACLLSLAGLGFGAKTMRGELGARTLLSMLGLVCQRTRTAEGLKSLLQQAMPDASIAVEEFHAVWVDTRGHAATPLGENCVLGGGFYDRSNAIRIVITPGCRRSVDDLIPGHSLYAAVMQLLQFYVGCQSQAALELRVRRALIPMPVLESQHLRLGYTTLLAPNAHDSDPAPIRIQLGMWNKPLPWLSPAAFKPAPEHHP